MRNLRFLTVAVLAFSLPCVVFASGDKDDKKAKLGLIIDRSLVDVERIDGSPRTRAKQPIAYSSVALALDNAIREADDTGDFVKKINRENCCKLFAAPCLGVAAALTCDNSNELINYFSRAACMRRVADAKKLQEILNNKKNQ